jgi:hypothetical protein
VKERAVAISADMFKPAIAAGPVGSSLAFAAFVFETLLWLLFGLPRAPQIYGGGNFSPFGNHLSRNVLACADPITAALSPSAIFWVPKRGATAAGTFVLESPVRKRLYADCVQVGILLWCDPAPSGHELRGVVCGGGLCCGVHLPRSLHPAFCSSEHKCSQIIENTKTGLPGYFVTKSRIAERMETTPNY